MTSPMLLDTCAAIWMANQAPISDQFLSELQRAEADGDAVFLSPISAWEIGMLVSRGKVSLPVSPQRWFKQLLEAPGLMLADMTCDLLIASSFLPGAPPRDPADRIIAATARENGYRLVTRDRPLLDYAEQGHIQALAC